MHGIPIGSFKKACFKLVLIKFLHYIYNTYFRKNKKTWGLSRKKCEKMDKSDHCTQVLIYFWSDISSRCSELDLLLKLIGRDLGGSLLTVGCYSEGVVSTRLTVCQKHIPVGLVQYSILNDLIVK